MSVFDDPAEPPAPNRLPLVAGAVVVLLAVAAAVVFLGGGDDEAPATAAAPVEAPRAAVPAARPADAPATPAPAAPSPAARRPAAPAPAPVEAPAAAAPAADAAVLVVESDVPGASVFVDREFVGTAPVTLKGVAPGTKRLNLSAEGFDGISRTVEVTPGEQTVTMRFKEVRLETSTEVAHKHGLGGGCEGTLRATIDGLRYDTANKGDAFTLRYDQIETFEVNYLEKNLRVKQRGGKTWNFTDRQADNADRLFVFHRDVQAARDKLAKGYVAAR
ncbi:MAG: PEGA domain-containing protein [Vicinamibacterales bacterium]